MRHDRRLRRAGSGIVVAGLVATAVTAIAAAPQVGAAPRAAGPHVGAAPLSVYKIGFEGPLSGLNMQFGVNEVNGAALAVSQANADGHLPFRLALVKQDDQGDPALAPGAAHALVNRPAVLGVVGPSFSGPIMAAGPIYNQAHLGYVSPSATNPTLAGNHWSTFHRVVPDDGLEGTFAADWLVRLHRPRLVVLVDQNPYGMAVGNAAIHEARNKGVPVTVLNHDFSAPTNYQAQAQRIAGTGIHTLFFAGFDFAAARLAKALSAIRYGALSVSGNGVFSSVFTQEAGASGQGWYVTCGCVTNYTSATARTFAGAYHSAYGSAPGLYSVEAYDATNAVIRAIKNAVANGHHSRAAVNAAIGQLNFGGIGAQVRFAANGNIARSVALVNLFQDRQGKLVQIGDIRTQPH